MFKKKCGYLVRVSQVTLPGAASIFASIGIAGCQYFEQFDIEIRNFSQIIIAVNFIKNRIA